MQNIKITIKKGTYGQKIYLIDNKEVARYIPMIKKYCVSEKIHFEKYKELKEYLLKEINAKI